MRCACIDIGSNTTRLLVAEPDGEGLREVLSHRVFNRSAPSVPETVAAQVRAAREAGAQDITVIGTAALRDAADGAAFCREIESVAGIGVTVLSGEEEARLAFLGATRTAGGVPEGRVGVVDVGGGSTEIAVGEAGGEVTWSLSLPIGSATLADECLINDPPSTEDLAHARSHARRMFASARCPNRVVAGYAVGGSATTLREIAGPALDFGLLERAIPLVCAESSENTGRSLGLPVERARVLPAAFVLLERGMVLLGVPLRVVPGGLREGLLLERLDTVRTGAKKRSQLSGGSAC